MDFILIINQIVILFIIMGVGYVVKRLNIIDTHFIKILTNFLLKVTLPALIISSMQLKTISPEIIKTTSILVGLSFVIYGFTIFMAWVLPKMLRVHKNQVGIYRFILVFANVGFIGYPVLEAVLGKESIFYGAIFNLPFNFLVYTLGIYYLSNEKGSEGFKLKDCINPGVVAVFIGFVLFFAGIKLPYAIGHSITMVGDLTTPLSMIIVGALLTQVDFKSLFKNGRLYVVCLYRMVILPIGIFLILKPFTDDLFLLGIPVILCGLPVAANTALLAEQYDNHPELASQSILLSTLLCIITIPILAYLLIM